MYGFENLTGNTEGTLPFGRKGSERGVAASFTSLVRKLAIAAAVELAIIYVGFAPLVAMPLYNFLLFHPDKMAYDVQPLLEKVRVQFGATAEDITFLTPTGVQLHGYYFQLPSSKKTVLISHGNGGNADLQIATAMDMLKCGASVMIYDYEGYGKSAGSPSIPAICQDGIAAYDYLAKSRGVRCENIVLYGNSLGSTVACQTLKQRGAAAIVLESGIDSLQALASEKLLPLRAYPDVLFPRPALDNGKILAETHPPLLIMHGTKDRLIPVAHAASLFERSSSPKQLVVIHRAGHSDLAARDPSHYLGALKKFLDSLS